MAASKEQQLEQAIRQLYKASDLDTFFTKVARLIANRDREAKVAGIKSLQDPATGYIYEMDDEAVGDQIRHILDA